MTETYWRGQLARNESEISRLVKENRDLRNKLSQHALQNDPSEDGEDG